MTRRPGRITESALVTAIALVAVVAFGRLEAFLILPLLVLWAAGRSFEDHGLRGGVTPPALVAHLGLAMAATSLTAGLVVVSGSLSPGIPSSLAYLLAVQLLVVAFPEECFFRGYLQTSLDHVFGRPFRLFGARVGHALWIQAIVFALAHLHEGDWTRLRVLPFGLFAGWLRARSGSILAPTLYHGLGNVLVVVLSAGAEGTES